MSLFEEIASSLAESLLGKARDVVQGNEEERALEQVWGQALAHMLHEVAPNLEQDEVIAAHVKSVLRGFVEGAGVAEGLMAMAVKGEPPPLDLLRERYAESEALQPLDARGGRAATRF